MPVYTKRGDKGKTSLFGCKERVGKDVLRIETIGSVDELNSYIGICKSVCESEKLKSLLGQVQSTLLTIGSILAGSSLKFYKSETNSLEKIIDETEKELPVLRNFVVPGGSKLASHLQYARTLARGAERKVVALSKEESVKPEILKYLNRLSDFLFMLARRANFAAGVDEEVWKVGNR